MKKILSLLFVLPVVLFSALPMVSAHESSVSTMAGIVLHLNHYPSNDEKTTLAEIVADAHATAGEKALAGALARMQHHVDGADAAALRALAADAHAAKGEQVLANVLLGINHHASDADKARLKALL